MKFTFSWLQKFLKTKRSLKDICEKLTLLGIEVSEIIDNQDVLKPFKIAQVVDVKDHPNADRLKLCKINDGNKTFNIVCGASNVKKNMKAILAPVGTRMPTGDFTIQKTQIRGVESEGMLCSAKEIGLGKEHEEIIELSANEKIGDSLSTLYPSEKIIDVEITPNRSDCLGINGIARDLAAGGMGDFLEKKVSKKKGKFKSDIEIIITKEAKKICPVFYGRYIKNVKNCESPEWFKKQLVAVGLKPISALVDITNYLTIDSNRPLHVFDADKIKGNLTVSLSNGGKNFNALDDQNYKLSKGMITISDDNDVISLAGVIGGSSTGCGLNTKNVFLESAIFDPISTAKTGRLLNIVTDARYRFERGVDPQSVITGIEEATNLILDFCGGETSELISDGSIPDNKRKIVFDFDTLEKFGGIKISEKETQNILNKLGFKILKKGKKYELISPSWRHDIENEQDITEEVLRIYGYDNIPSQSIYINNQNSIDNRCQIRELSMKRCLALKGLTETVTWSFISKQNAKLFGFKGELLEITNPISSDLDIMRPSIIPNLLQAISNNVAKGETQICLFELGPIFGNIKDMHGKIPDIQEIGLAGVRYGKKTKHWLETERDYDLFDVKSDLESLLKCCKLSSSSYSIKNEGITDYYHPRKSGTFFFPDSASGAMFGEIHPDIIKKLDIDQPVFAFELSLFSLPHEVVDKKKIFKNKYFQKVERDFAFIVDKNIEAGDIASIAAEVDEELIDKVYIFDVYEGEGIPEGKKSLAISVTLQPTKKTLTDLEIEEIGKKIVENIVKSFRATIREK